MSRLDHLRLYTDKSTLGIEIAPYYNPIVTKKAGYDLMIVDVFDTETLRRRALEDPLIPNERVEEVEAVDIVADASDLAAEIATRGLAGKVGYIVSSHNFEHLPNPIRFLQGCSLALKPGGVLTMAIPDYRACFDHFRMPTRLSDWLSAYHHGYRQPLPETRFDFRTCQSMYMRGATPQVGCDIDVDDPSFFEPVRVMRHAYQEYVADLAAPPPYKDAHCSAVFGASFELMVQDLRHFGLIDLEVIDVTPTAGLEFFAYLRKPSESAAAPEDDDSYYRRRAQLQAKVNAQLGAAGFALVMQRATRPIPARSRLKATLRRILGQRGYDGLLRLNRMRRRLGRA